ncbi:hypothetical protein JCM10213_006360 [Rhodosporidiobolus nylandii]
MDYADDRAIPSASYALESSDGESDWAEDELPLSARRTLAENAGREKPLKPDAVVELRGNVGGLRKGGEVVWLVGEAGERIAQGVEAQRSGEVVQVLVDEEQIGSIQPSEAGATLVFLSTAIPLASLHPLALALLSALEPSSSTILSSYHLPSWIPPSEDAPSSAAPVLFLTSPTSASALAQLRSIGAVSPFTPPNLLHGLPSILLMLASLAPSSTSSALLLPTTTPPQPLNGPFSPLSPVSHVAAQTIYDYGGETGLSDPGALFRELSGSRGPLRTIKEQLGWSWWQPERKDGRAFEWLEKQRRDRRREEVGSMYM